MGRIVEGEEMTLEERREKLLKWAECHCKGGYFTREEKVKALNKVIERGNEKVTD